MVKLNRLFKLVTYFVLLKNTSHNSKMSFLATWVWIIVQPTKYEQLFRPAFCAHTHTRIYICMDVYVCVWLKPWNSDAHSSRITTILLRNEFLLFHSVCLFCPSNNIIVKICLRQTNALWSGLRMHRIWDRKAKKIKTQCPLIRPVRFRRASLNWSIVRNVEKKNNSPTVFRSV